MNPLRAIMLRIGLTECPHFLPEATPAPARRSADCKRDAAGNTYEDEYPR